MLSESLAQYSALMVMEKEYGSEKMRRFLKYKLDNCLRSRGTELVEAILAIGRMKGQGVRTPHFCSSSARRPPSRSFATSPSSGSSRSLPLRTA